MAVATAGLLVPLIAFATGNGWWFQQKTAYPIPVKPVNGVPSIIGSGRIDGRRWTAVAYLSKPPGNFPVAHKLHALGQELVCVTVSLGNLSNQPRGTGCGLLRGMPVPPHAGRGSWITFLNNGDPAIITGAVARNVARAEFVLDTDGDNQYPQAVIGRLVAPIIADEADIVVADRQTHQIEHFSLTKKLLQRVG